MMNSVIEFLSNIPTLLFKENPTVTDLVTIALLAAIFWFLSFTIVIQILKPILSTKEWFLTAAKNDYHRSAKAMNEKLGMKQTEEEYVEFFKYQWPWLQCVCFQHFMGGALCLPSILGLVDNKTGTSLACLGILSECGWEIEDMAVWLYKRYIAENGRQKVPFALLIILAMHHSLTMMLGLPAILVYGHVKTLHWICFELQAASSVALFVQEFTKLLDVSKPKELRIFQGMTGLTLAIMIWCRAIHWPILVYQMCTVWYEDKAWGFMTVGLLMSVIFTLFSWAVCIEPCYKKFMKFLKLSAEYQAMPESQRRSSIMELQAAAQEVFAKTALEEEFLASLYDRKVDRRGTVPASFFTASQQQKRPSGVNLLRASVGDLSSTLSRMSALQDSTTNKKDN